MAGDKQVATKADESTPDKYPEVLFYYANILDYFRLLFLYWACCTDGLSPQPPTRLSCCNKSFAAGVIYSTFQPLCGSNGMYFAVMYTISMGLDAFDGMLARHFNQCSKFGYYADMIIDRISSITALVYGAQALKDQNHPQAALLIPLFCFCIVMVELLAHGVVCYYAEFMGIHQKLLGHQFAVVRLYLDNKLFLGGSCIAYEALPLAIIAEIPILAAISLPGFVFRVVANTARLYACAVMDTKADSKTQ